MTTQGVEVWTAHPATEKEEGREVDSKIRGEKMKSSQDVIRVLHNGGSDAVCQASGLELA